MLLRDPKAGKGEVTRTNWIPNFSISHLSGQAKRKIPTDPSTSWNLALPCSFPWQFSCCWSCSEIEGNSGFPLSQKGFWSLKNRNCAIMPGKKPQNSRKIVLGRVFPMEKFPKQRWKSSTSPTKWNKILFLCWKKPQGRCRATQVIPSCDNSQEIWDLLSLPGATQVSQGTRQGLKIKLGIWQVSQEKDFWRWEGFFWGRRDCF